ncbi:MAG: hypothetical protein ACD_75C01360G0003 [uncultured bacterium]|nr:MAG: hypothetical protein ACD_75C01360G0003 [uncultured bacterium]
MAQNVKKCSLLLWPKTFALCISLFAAFTYAKIAVGAPLNTPEESREIEQPEASDSAPSKVSIARVQSAAQKTVQEEALKNQANGSTPLSPLVSKSGGHIKKVKNIAVSTSSDKSDMKQMRGPTAIQNDDSLSTDSDAKSKPSKGKSSAKKEDSFD